MIARRGVLAAALALPLLTSATPVTALVVREQRPGRREFARIPVGQGDIVEFSWIHSVDGTPWTEFYRVAGRELVLDCTEMSLTGAGTPSSAPEVSYSGDQTRMCGLDLTFDAVRWIHSHDVDHRIVVGGALLIAPEAVPHHCRAELAVV